MLGELVHEFGLTLSRFVKKGRTFHASFHRVLMQRTSFILFYVQVDSKMDYSKMTLEELIAEEKRIKKMEITSAVGIGFLIGIMVYGVARNGFGFLYIFIPVLLIAGIARNSQSLKRKREQIRAEISTKSNR